MKRDSGYARSPGGDTDSDASNRGGSSKERRQKTGGCYDDTPGQVGVSNVSASVLLTNPKRIDSMGGSESRGRDNYKRSGD